MAGKRHPIGTTAFLLALCFASWVVLFGRHGARFTAQVSGGATYYVCDCGQGSTPGCVPGNDANPGTSVSTPKQTISAANTLANTFDGGETLAFCNGGAWDVPAGSTSYPYIRLRYSSSTAQTPITFTNYTTSWGAPGGQTVLPLVRARMWIDNGTRKIGLIFRNLHLYGDDSGSGIFFDNAEDVLMENLTIEHFNSAIYAKSDKDGIFAMNERVTLRDSRILNNAGQGWLGGAVDTLIENNTFHNNGWRNNENGYPNGQEPMFFHNIYISGYDINKPMSGIIRGNTLSRSAPTLTDDCASASLVGHSQIADLLVEGNTFTAPDATTGNGCWGVGLGLLKNGDTLRRITIRNNTFENMGNTALHLEACENCLVEGNLFIHRAYDNFTFRAIRTEPKAWSYPSPPPTQNVIRFNTVVYAMANGKEGSRAIHANVGGTGNRIEGNVVHNVRTADQGFRCLEVTAPDPSIITMDRNVCSFANPIWVTFNGANRTLADQQAAGFDLHSFFADPLFTSLSNFLPQSGSPLIDAGGTGCPSLDLNGRSRPQGSACDIGAFEAGTGDGSTSSATSSAQLCVTLSPKRAGFTVLQAVISLLQGQTIVVSPQTVTVDAAGKACLQSSVLSALNVNQSYTVNVRGKMYVTKTLTVPNLLSSNPYPLTDILAGDFNDDGIMDLSDLLSFVDYIKNQNNTNFSQVSSSATFSDLLRAIIDAIRQYKEG